MKFRLDPLLNKFYFRKRGKRDMNIFYFGGTFVFLNESTDSLYFYEDPRQMWLESTEDTFKRVSLYKVNISK